MISYNIQSLALEVVDRRTGQLRVFTPKVNRQNKLELNLLYYTWLSEFPEGISKMRKLKVLRLCTDNIHSSPKTIAKLRELEELDLLTSYYGYSAEPSSEGVGPVLLGLVDSQC